MADLIGMSLDQKAECFVGFVFGGAHRVAKFEPKGNHVLCVPFHSLATFDDDKLTQIVIASHKLGLRAEVTNNGMRGLKILLHNRPLREGRMWERHPRLEDVLRESEVANDQS
jgi:hypothetical protein